MRNRFFIFFFTLLAISCSKTENEGFLGDWVGETTIIVNGNPVSSEITASIADNDGFARECAIFSSEESYLFDAVEENGRIIYNNAEVVNLTVDDMITYITGEATLIGDTLLIFEHEVITMDGSTVVSSNDDYLEFKREE